MENVKYVMLCWEEDLENNSFVIFLSDTVRRNNGIVHSFLKKEPGYGDKYFARADYRRKYPEAKIIDVM